MSNTDVRIFRSLRLAQKWEAKRYGRSPYPHKVFKEKGEGSWLDYDSPRWRVAEKHAIPAFPRHKSAGGKKKRIPQRNPVADEKIAYRWLEEREWYAEQAWEKLLQYTALAKQTATKAAELRERYAAVFVRHWDEDETMSYIRETVQWGIITQGDIRRLERMEDELLHYAAHLLDTYFNTSPLYQRKE